MRRNKILSNSSRKFCWIEDKNGQLIIALTKHFKKKWDRVDFHKIFQGYGLAFSLLDPLGRIEYFSPKWDGVENEKIKGLYGEKFVFSTEFGSVRRLPGKDELLMRFLGKTAPIGQLQYARAFTP